MKYIKWWEGAIVVIIENHSNAKKVLEIARSLYNETKEFNDEKVLNTLEKKRDITGYGIRIGEKKGYKFIGYCSSHEWYGNDYEFIYCEDFLNKCELNCIENTKDEHNDLEICEEDKQKGDVDNNMKYKILDDEFAKLFGFKKDQIIKCHFDLTEKAVNFGVSKGFLKLITERADIQCSKLFFDKIKQLNGDWEPNFYGDDYHYSIQNYKNILSLREDKNYKIMDKKYYLKSLECAKELINFLEENEDIKRWFIDR